MSKAYSFFTQPVDVGSSERKAFIESKPVGSMLVGQKKKFGLVSTILSSRLFVFTIHRVLVRLREEIKVCCHRIDPAYPERFLPPATGLAAQRFFRLPKTI